MEEVLRHVLEVSWYIKSCSQYNTTLQWYIDDWAHVSYVFCPLEIPSQILKIFHLLLLPSLMIEPIFPLFVALSKTGKSKKIK